MKGSEWTPIYLMIVLIIAAILLVEVVKPVMKQAASSASSNLQQSSNLIGGFSLFSVDFKKLKRFLSGKLSVFHLRILSVWAKAIKPFSI